MPRQSVASHAAVEYALQGPKLAPPVGLTKEQAGYWRALVDAFPAERFGVDHVPVLLELVRHMATSARIDEGLSAMKRRPKGADFFALATAARDEAKLIAALASKLRLTPDTTKAQQQAENERKRTPPGPRPWEARVEDATTAN
jgi:hypothetical protein